MRTRYMSAVVAGCGLFLTTSPVLAHHFTPHDSEKAISIVGKLSRLEWVNPHARLFLDVTDNTGKVATWEIELGGIAALTSRGWTRLALRAGDVVTVDAFPWKGRVNAAVARDVRLPDGRKVFAGSHAGDPVPAPR